MGMTSYASFKAENKVIPVTDQKSLILQDVGPRIALAAGNFLREKGEAKRVAGYQWEFNLFEDPAVNAWAMPGGKIAVYTGILGYTKDASGLATVLGHEVAHVIARHGNERMSQQLAIYLGGVSLQVAMQKEPEKTQDVYMMVYGVGSTLGSLAYSRQHEYEADKIGMVLMALAGYDPAGSISFWERMSAKSAPPIPEFLSTHPSDANRVAAMKAFLPEAKKYLKAQ